MKQVQPRPAATTTDALKAVALGLVFVDHIGHYLLEDWAILRVIGRLGVPIFFFLIGFAKSRGMPGRWLIFGLGLTLVDYFWTGDISETQLSILFNFATIRLALPLIEREVLASPWRLAALAMLLALLIIPADRLIEYGTVGWLLALAGLLQRRYLDRPEAREGAERLIYGIAALAVFLADEINDYGFTLPHGLLLAAGLAAVGLVLHRFRRGDLARQPGARLGAAMRFCGRYSLEIYAAQIILLAAAGALWSHPGDDGDNEEDDDED